MSKKNYKTHPSNVELRSLRGNISIKDYADKLGTSLRSMYNYEDGSRKVPEYILRLAKYVQWANRDGIDPLKESNSNAIPKAADNVIAGRSKMSHPEIISRFKDQKLAREINYDMLKLEEADPAALREIRGYVKRMLSETDTPLEKDAPLKKRRSK